MLVSTTNAELLAQVAHLPPNTLPHPAPDRLPEALVVAHRHPRLHLKELALAATMEAMKSYAKNMHYDSHDSDAMERFMGEAMFHAEMLREEKGADIGEKDALEMAAKTARGVWVDIGADQVEHMAHDLTDMWEMLEQGEARKHYLDSE